MRVTLQMLYELFRVKVEATEKASAHSTVYESYQVINNKMRLLVHNAAAGA